MRDGMRLRNDLYAMVTARWFVLLVYIGVVVAGSIQKYFAGEHSNFKIFVASADNLIHLRDLYGPRYDTYHYTPTFAFLMIPFLYVPDWLGVIIWNLVNALPLFYALGSLDLRGRQKAMIWWVVLWELLTSIQNFQTNGLIAALFVWGFAAIERGHPLWAALCIALSTSIKVFGVAGALFFLLSPQGAVASVYLGLWCLLLALLPWLVVPLGHLIDLYRRWLAQLLLVQQQSYGTSVMGVLRVWFGVRVGNLWIQLAGLGILCVPFLLWKRHRSLHFRYLLLGSTMIWAVLFNHKAESPAFVIAMTGVAMWFAVQHRTKVNLALLGLALVFTSFYPDLLPQWIRETYMTPYAVKAVPCLLIWLKLQADIFREPQGQAP
jgi:hypothetical protein